MNLLEILCITFSSILAVIFIIVRTFKGGLLGLITKILASFGFVASSILTVAIIDTTTSIRLIMGLLSIGLLCGMIGDILLDLKVIYGNNNVYLNTGMLSFGIGHIMYFFAFSLFSLENYIDLLTPIIIAIVSAIVITIFITLSSKTMGLDFGNFKGQTIAYTFILSFMTVYSLVLAIMGGTPWIGFIGMFLFFCSDIVLSFQYFGGKLENKIFIATNHTLYYTAQITLLATLITLI